VATAASIDSLPFAAGATRYGWYGVPEMAFTASYMAPCTMAKKRPVFCGG
jgi:hypothetical protein